MPNIEVFLQTQVGACVAHLYAHFLLTCMILQQRKDQKPVRCNMFFAFLQDVLYSKLCYTLLQVDTFNLQLYTARPLSAISSRLTFGQWDIGVLENQYVKTERLYLLRCKSYCILAPCFFENAFVRHKYERIFLSGKPDVDEWTNISPKTLAVKYSCAFDQQYHL